VHAGTWQGHLGFFQRVRSLVNLGKHRVDRAVLPAFTSAVAVVVFVQRHGTVFVSVVLAHATFVPVLAHTLALAHAVVWLDLLVFFG